MQLLGYGMLRRDTTPIAVCALLRELGPAECIKDGVEKTLSSFVLL